MWRFAGILQALEICNKVSRCLCTAEVGGSNPLGSTTKSRILRVKREGSVEVTDKLRGLMLQPLLQRVFQSMLFARKAVAENHLGAACRGLRASVQQVALMAVFISLRFSAASFTLTPTTPEPTPKGPHG